MNWPKFIWIKKMFKERCFNKTIVIVTSFCYIKYKTEINKN